MTRTRATNSSSSNGNTEAFREFFKKLRAMTQMMKDYMSAPTVFSLDQAESRLIERFWRLVSPNILRTWGIRKSREMEEEARDIDGSFNGSRDEVVRGYSGMASGSPLGDWIRRSGLYPERCGCEEAILEEAYRSHYAIHPWSPKLYQDLKKIFWWNDMKRGIALFVSQCLTCQQVKVEHQKPVGLLQPLPMLEWKWEHIAMDFVSGLRRMSSE
ncbi:uncharacterized protein LOC105420028 [Amborella trichopoda]|uniref:uncharacterized protein LOC105420028 n=1 Tax=Amborella trichopoda TaxID=13333 RepID=UPI0005D2E1DE|nr:uncharacterized protein LOC105420028 [Amborella trichopoda]|eukprot:XP_011620373.1 uncharacterized protein LOC105420028 [Amborella trichopoda]